MSQRLQDTAKWLWCILLFQAGPMWRGVSAVKLQAPPSEPATIEAQAKFFHKENRYRYMRPKHSLLDPAGPVTTANELLPACGLLRRYKQNPCLQQDFFSVQLSPYKIEFGHVCEDPNTWEQRYEKKDFENHRDMGKVRWGDKQGGYGEHYWDLNHAGHTDDHGDDGHDSDDGSYHGDTYDPYDEPTELVSNYNTGDYNSEENNNEESNRAKRAHSRHVTQTQKKHKEYDESPEQPPESTSNPPRHRIRKNNQRKQYANQVNNKKNVDTIVETTNNKDRGYDDKTKHEKNNENDNEYNNRRSKYKNDVVVVADNKDTSNEDISDDSERKNYAQHENTFPEKNYSPSQENGNLESTYHKPPEVGTTGNQFYVPYEGGAGVRQHYQPEATASASSPRLFLEPATGHIIDRTTGQAYVLQPVVQNYY